jgi:hypothetical protein
LGCRGSAIPDFLVRITIFRNVILARQGKLKQQMTNQMYGLFSGHASSQWVVRIQALGEVFSGEGQKMVKMSEAGKSVKCGFWESIVPVSGRQIT